MQLVTEEIPFNEYIAELSIPELSDLSTEIYFAYQHSSEKEPLRLKYNQVSELYNARTKRNELVTIKPGGVISGEDEAVVTIENKAKPAVVPGVTGIIEQIITLHKQGKSNQEIIALGFNRSTVGRQVGEYKKNKKK